MGISIPGININPGIGGASIPAQSPFADAGNGFVQAYLASKDAATRRSMSSAELDIRKQELALRIAEQKTEQEKWKHQQEITAQQGEATQLFLEHALPFMSQSGQLGQMLQGMGQPASPEAVQHAMPGMEQAHDQGVAQSGDQYNNFLKQMDPEALANFMQHVQPVLKDIQTQHDREAIAARFPAVPNETGPQALNRIRKLTAAYAASGDHAMVASLAEAAGALKPETVQYEWFAKRDGTTVYLPKEEGSRMGLGKPITASGFGFGPGGPVGAMRAMSAIAGMGDANEKMRRFELQVASKQADLTDLDFFRGQLATMYNDAAKETGLAGHVIPFFGTASGSVVLARLNRSNPDLANYLQAASQWALEESALSNRPSDFRTKMDEFVSAIKPDAKVQSIHDLWRSRAVRLAGFQRGVPALQNLLDRAANAPTQSPSPGTTILLPDQP